MIDVELINIFVGTFITTSLPNILDFNNDDKSTYEKDYIDKVPPAILCGNDQRHQNLREATCGVPNDPSREYPFLGIPSLVSAYTPRYKSHGKGWYPRNVTDLEKFCSVIHSYAPCLINLELQCNGDSKIFLGSALDVCENGSDFYNAVKENMECMYEKWINEYKWDTTCKADSMHLDSHIYPLEGTGVVSNVTRIHLLTFHDLGCLLKSVECPTAENAILEIYARIYGWFLLSPELIDEDKDSFLHIMDRLLIKDEQKKRILYGMEAYEEKCLEIKCTEYENKLRELYI